MASIASVLIETPDTAAAERFYADAFGLDSELGVRASDAPTSGFRGFTLSLVVAQPSIVDSLYGTALDGGATAVKPASKSLWGYGGTLRDPFGVVWQIATSNKKNSGPETRDVDSVVFLLGAADILATRKFYEGRGFEVEKAYGRKYIEFKNPGSGVTLALYNRKGLAKVAGVDPEGSGSHRIVLRGAGDFTDPDGFAWES
ncbi:glyoxalase [Glycomyces harbinensis]|uniref:Glyoxalase n=1 Tax=Glycomyces harbinensis TaxID=58114 RepID=A0A1G7AF74_9ACTN|nr:glyoxalase [Glycomyces harbinensis]SDE13420.1 hypothetical protein SAMN05216270_113107 [Glycomyces harbinensis]